MIITGEISLTTRGYGDIKDITGAVDKILKNSGLKNGIITVFVNGSTAGITTIEYEPGLISDFKQLWERIAPENIPYGHNERWGDGNGYAHVRASLLGASLTIPVTGSKMTLGTWQQIILVDFDNRPRQRTIIVHLMGD